MKTLCAAAAIALLTLGACAKVDRPPTYGVVSNSRPPVEFRGGVTALVVFSDNVARDCRRAGLQAVAGAVVNACSVIGGEQPVIIIPNSCKQNGIHAENICHEIAHVNGWPHVHGK